MPDLPCYGKQLIWLTILDSSTLPAGIIGEGKKPFSLEKPIEILEAQDIDVWVSHIIDPRTGSVIGETVEAIVVADRAAIADGWSTALLVVGANRAALRLVEKAGIEANILDSSGRNMITDGWESAVSGIALDSD